jgi:hypothetical protein
MMTVQAEKLFFRSVLSKKEINSILAMHHPLMSNGSHGGQL